MTGRNDPCWCGSGKKYKRCHADIDARGSGTGTPPRSKYVKTSQAIEGMRRAGRFNGELLDYVREHVRAGISTGEIDRLVHDYTLDHGHIPACLGYHGFTRSCCTSVNNVVCHGIPSRTQVLREGDVVNVDLTTIVDGYHGDSSETFCIGSVPQEARELVRTTAQALLRGIGAVAPGRPLRDIGAAIEPYVNEQGCSVVRQYTGHGIGLKFHEGFTVYHHQTDDEGDIIMEPGMTFTIEPMINRGSWRVVTDPVDKWTVRTRDGSLSAQFEHTVLVIPHGVEVLTATPAQRLSGTYLLVDGIELF